MSLGMRALRVPLVALFLWAALSVIAPLAMARYDPYLFTAGPTATCPRNIPAGVTFTRALRTCGTPLSEQYEEPLPLLIADAGMRSVVLLLGAAVIALTLGVAIGAISGAVRRRAFASGAMLAATGLTAAIPSFFVAYFLQIAVIVFGANQVTGTRFLPVYGFGYDEHKRAGSKGRGIPTRDRLQRDVTDALPLEDVLDDGEARD